MVSQDDIGHMRAALQLARRNLGSVWPNPAVGCVLVKQGVVVGRGWTQRTGRPHAETVALAHAGAAAAGATAYVTLEPCSHHGQTPPCANALIAAKVSRVVAAVEDPDPRVSGRGLAALRQAGIAVESDVLADEAAEINAGFFLRVRENRPLVTVKAATTLDGRIATHRGDSKWITGEASRHRAHALCAQHDAILVGIGTARADDPQLTCRLPGLSARSPVRVLLDPRLRLPLTAQLIQTAQKVPTWVVCYTDADRGRRDILTQCGVELIDLAPSGDRPDVGEMLHALAARGITRLLVEGGGRVTGAFLGARLIDRIVWFRAGSMIGGDGTPVAAAFGVDHLADAPKFRRIAAEPCGEDTMETYAVAR